MNIKQWENIWYVVSIALTVILVGNAIMVELEKTNSKYDSRRSNQEELQYQIMLEKGQFYVVEVEISIGDCDGETELISQVQILLDNEEVLNQTRRTHESELSCNLRDPEDPATIRTSFDYTTSNLENDGNLTVSGIILKNTKTFHVYWVRVYQNYNYDNSVQVLLMILAGVSWVITIILALLAPINKGKDKITP